MKILLSNHVQTTGISPWRGSLCSVRVGLGPLASNLEGIFARTGLPHLGRLNLLRSTWYSSWRGVCVMVRQTWFTWFSAFFPHIICLCCDLSCWHCLSVKYCGWHHPRHARLCCLGVPSLPLAWHNWWYLHKIFSTHVYPAPLVGWLQGVPKNSIPSFQVMVGCSVEGGLHNQSSGGGCTWPGWQWVGEGESYLIMFNHINY